MCQPVAVVRMAGVTIAVVAADPAAYRALPRQASIERRIAEYGRPTHCVSEAHTCVQIVRFCARWLQSAFIIHRFQAITQRMVFVRSQPSPRSR